MIFRSSKTTKKWTGTTTTEWLDVQEVVVGKWSILDPSKRGSKRGEKGVPNGVPKGPKTGGAKTVEKRCKNA